MAPTSSARSAGAVAAVLMAAASLPPASHAFAPLAVGRPGAPPSPLTTSAPTSSLDAIRRGGGNRRGGGRKKAEYVPPMNGEIRQPQLRVNVATKDGKDESLGILSKADALAKAQELGGLDLILINANSDPPVCKIVDYSKYRYAQEKKRKEKAKNSKATEIKEVKMSYKIGDHDYNVRLKAATKFIKQGNRVKATIQFRGREVQHDKLGVSLLERLASDLEDIGTMEGRPRREGRNLGAILTPRAEVVKAINEAKRKREREKKRKKEESLARRTMEEEAKEAAARAKAEFEASGAEAVAGGVLDGLDLGDDFDDEEDDGELDASLDELLGSTKVSDDLFA